VFLLNNFIALPYIIYYEGQKSLNILLRRFA
jgi:hypothetical protein